MEKIATKNRIALDGEWDLSRRTELLGLCDGLTRDSAATIDLRGCEYLDSTVLSILAALRMKFAEVPITLLGPTRTVLKVLKIVGFERLFRIVDAGS